MTGVASLAVLLGPWRCWTPSGPPGAPFTSFGDAGWWAVATVTTAGYRDVHPVTWEGRVGAVALMLLGIGLGASSEPAPATATRWPEAARPGVGGRVYRW